MIGLVYLAVAVGLDRYGQRAPAGKFDVIAVAGCRVLETGAPSVALRRRVRVAVRLWKDDIAPQIVFTGGVGDHPPSEAEAAARFAESLGVPRSAMHLESRSTSTEENARFAAEELGSNKRVVVVSSAYHVFRCERVFARHFDEVVGTGAIETAWPRSRGALREVFALASYALLGRL
ncbi:MAG: YdcF family protein [Polyangiales bacterium]